MPRERSRIPPRWIELRVVAASGRDLLGEVRMAPGERLEVLAVRFGKGRLGLQILARSIEASCVRARLSILGPWANSFEIGLTNWSTEDGSRRSTRSCWQSSRFDECYRCFIAIEHTDTLLRH